MSLKRTIVFLLILIHTGCGADKRAVPEIARDLSKPMTQQGVGLDLTEVSLKTHADFDEFESRVLSKMNLKNALELYEALADRNRAGDARHDALLLSRRVLFIFEVANRASENEAQSASIRKGLELKGQLTKDFPNDPHTLYAEGYVLLRLYQIYGTHYRSSSQASGAEDIGKQSARQLKKIWNKLLTIAPEYKGPRNFNADRIRKELDRLAVLSKEGVVDRVAQSGFRPVNSENLTSARESLWSLENKPQQASSVCRDYQKAITGKDGLALPLSFVEAEIGLTCGLLLGNRELALLGLGQLIVRGAKTDVCKELEAIRCSNNSRACSDMRQILTNSAIKDDLCKTAAFFSSQALVALGNFQSFKRPTQSPQTESLDITENKQRIRRREDPNGAIIALAVSRRIENVDGIAPTDAIESSLNTVLEHEATRQQCIRLTGSLLGKERAIDSSLRSDTFDTHKGHLFRFKGLGTNNPAQSSNISFFISHHGPPKESKRWVTSAWSVILNEGTEDGMDAWSHPVFPELPQVKTPTEPTTKPLTNDSPATKTENDSGKEAPTRPKPLVPTPDKPKQK